MPRRPAIARQDGFTLIELIVVVAIIAILAAIALPAFLGQRAKGEDASAKSNARNMVSAMETCFNEVQLYDPCPDADSGLAVGAGPGQVEVTPSGDTYVIVAHSKNGNTFTVEKLIDGTVRRTCDGTAQPKGGCDAGTW